MRTEPLSFTSLMFLNFRKHDEKDFNYLPYFISTVLSLCHTPWQSSKVSLFWCLHLPLRRNLIYCFSSLIDFTICWCKLKQVTLFSSSSCLFSSSVCWVKACLPRISWEIRDSFSSSCRVSSPREKMFIFQAVIWDIKHRNEKSYTESDDKI